MEMLEYQKATSLDHAVALLKDAAGPCLLIAGGTDVLVKARSGSPYADRTVIDIYGLKELGGIRETEDSLLIGGGVTHTEIVESPLVRQHCGVLADACNTVGSLQIRNHATIGGNIANASPAADSLAALSVLEAELIINRLGVKRQVPLGEVISRPYQTTLNDRDIIVAIKVKKLPGGCRYDFTKLGRRDALAISRMTIATVLNLNAAGIVTHFAMTMGATFPKPVLFPEIYSTLIGQPLNDANIRAVSKALSDQIPAIAGIRPSTVYKQPVCEKLCCRILTKLAGGIDNG